MNSYLIGTGAGVVALFVLIRLLIWYFDQTVCVECYAKIRVRHAKSAGYKNKEMYLCKECHVMQGMLWTKLK